MTRRERLERKAERRAEWAEKADKVSEASFRGAREATAGIPPGQPILVGHHSEKRHRAALRRHDARMRKGCERADMAANHRSKADGLQRQLDNSIFSDDPDAVEALQERIAALEAERDRRKSINAEWRKAGRPGYCAASEAELPAWRAQWGKVQERTGLTDADLSAILKTWSVCPYEKRPYPSYSLSNLGGRIAAAKKRIQAVKVRAERAAAAEDAGGVLIRRHPEHNWCSVTFAEKPERQILTALKTAGYGWGGGSWQGYLDRLPDCVAAMETDAA